MSFNTQVIAVALLHVLCIWHVAQTVQCTEPEEQRSGVTSNRVLVDAIGSTAVRVAWWTEDGSWISRYSISCSENLTSKRNSTMATGVGHMQSAVVLDFKAKSINSVDLEVSQLLPFTNYSCCLIEHYINTTFNAEVCQHTTTLPQVNSDRPVCDSTDCPNDSHIGSTVSLFVMLLLAMLCILLLTLLVIKQGKDGEKITHWYAEVKHQNEVLKRQKVDNCDDTVIVEEGTIEDTMSCQNSPARMADSTEEASSIVTSACVAYRSVAARNPSQESDSDDSVVYAMPFDT